MAPTESIERIVELAARAYRAHWSPYGYTPTLWICALFVALFTLSTIVHLGQSVISRRWFLIPTVVLCGCGEIIGWAARLWSAKNVSHPTPFLMQISFTTIISPTFLSAAMFIILGSIINRVGPQYSRLSARNYAIIFVSADICALVIQAIGGGMASSAAQRVGGNPDKGGHVMLVGIIIQLVAIVVYAALALDFLVNLKRRKTVRNVVPTENTSVSPTEEKISGYGTGSGYVSGHMKLLIVGLALSTLCLFIRAVYRTAELRQVDDGWGGRIIHTQVYFNVLDGAMIVLAMYSLNILHPNHLLDHGH